MSDYLSQTEVVFAVLFGSRAQGTADESSDVDVALQFPDEMDIHERFRLRNRIDASLQEYAEGFVDVSDIGSLPTPIAHAALLDGIVLVGDEHVVELFRDQVKQEYEATADERERERRESIDRLAQEDT
jgi:predicted nucleotidyltransferase